MKIISGFEIRSLGDSAISVQLGQGIDENVHNKLLNFIKQIEANPFLGLIEIVPCYNSLTIFYDPLKILTYINGQTVMEYIHHQLDICYDSISNDFNFDHNIIEIPVIYGGEFGPDLDIVASHNNMTAEEVINIHSSHEYMVYMIGFAPGFPFLGGMSPSIATPRKKTPRQKIPTGSVGIAGQQTGIYPFETPGGWQIIGKTHTDLFLPEKNPPTLLQAGDKIKFIPVSEDQA